MDRNVELWLQMQHRAEIMRLYILPSLARFAVMATGIGIGYLIGNM